MRTSLQLLTWNRGEMVVSTLRHNLANAGLPIDEVVWCDNGSTDDDGEVMAKGVEELKKEYGFDLTVILNFKNLGVAKGYNRAAVLTTGDFIAITGCDCLMPDGWLSDMMKVMDADPTAAIVSIYTQPIEKVAERKRGAPYCIGKLEIIPALPFGRRLYRRSLLQATGFLREDFGLYGYEDCEWGERVLRVCAEHGWKSLAITNRIAGHLGTEGNNKFDGKDVKEYHDFKAKEVADPKKLELLKKCGDEKYPLYNPFPC